MFCYGLETFISLIHLPKYSASVQQGVVQLDVFTAAAPQGSPLIQSLARRVGVGRRLCRWPVTKGRIC